MLTSISGRQFEIISRNDEERTIVFKCNGITYETIPLSEDDYEGSDYWTGNDWAQFMKTDEYIIKK